MCFLSLYEALEFSGIFHKQHPMVLFCIWLLSLGIIVLRFTHVVACTDSSLHFLPGGYSIVWRYHRVFIHLLVDGNLGYFPDSGYILKDELKEFADG